MMTDEIHGMGLCSSAGKLGIWTMAMYVKKQENMANLF